MLVTFALTLVVPLQWAVFLGMVLSAAVFVYQQSNRVTLVEGRSCQEQVARRASGAAVATEQ